ncbi:MAG: phosphate acyltransferase PlsX [Lentisphaeria bacterium]|nr:phosphate acyltransferase PlsX [Lentisphaeria bacterium]
MMSNITIAVDMMGGDYAPSAVVDGVAEALQRFGDDYHLLLVGDEAQVKEGLAAVGVAVDDPRIELVHAPEVIGMNEHPVRAIREKRQSSIVTCMELVKSGRAEGVFSAGNTGAAVGASFLKWRMLEGLARPGIATILPGEKSPWVLMDSGATVDCTPTVLAQFAIMGDLYAKKVLAIANPRSGLLANGTEEGKGHRRVQEAFNLIKNIKDINFIGNIEGHDLFCGNVDVVVCDGFVGNIVLKTSEQLGKSLTGMIKESVMKKMLWKVGGLLSKGAFAEVKKRMDASEVGGAPLLGVKGCCIIGHGNFRGHGVANGIRAVGELIREQLNEHIVEAVHQCAFESIG